MQETFNTRKQQNFHLSGFFLILFPTNLFLLSIIILCLAVLCIALLGKSISAHFKMQRSNGLLHPFEQYKFSVLCVPMFDLLFKVTAINSIRVVKNYQQLDNYRTMHCKVAYYLLCLYFSLSLLLPWRSCMFNKKAVFTFCNFLTVRHYRTVKRFTFIRSGA